MHPKQPNSLIKEGIIKSTKRYMRSAEFNKNLIEAAPMSGISKMGQTIRSKLPGLGAEVATGKLQVGQLANQIAKEYYRYLGTKPKQNQQPTAQNLLKFLQQKQYPLQSAKEVLKTALSEIANINEKTPAIKPSQRMAQIQQTATKNSQSTNPTLQATTSSQPANINTKILTQAQVNSAIIAAASDKINKNFTASKTPTTPKNGSDDAIPHTTKTTPSSNTSPKIAQSFVAGLQGRQMPSGRENSITRIDFNDTKSVNTIIQQMNNFAKQGGKLNPKSKAILQQIINKL